MFTVISFYTQDWKYPQFARRLIHDCHCLDIPHRIEERLSTGSYLRNTCMKPKFIWEKLIELKSPILWIDCDGSLCERPTFFDGLDCDMAAKRMPPARVRTWHVGTLWLNYTPAVMSFMERWMKNTGAISDESALEKTWREQPINVVDIPPEYFVILQRGKLPRPGDVICHRISEGDAKKRELPGAIKKGKSGIL